MYHDHVLHEHILMESLIEIFQFNHLQKETLSHHLKYIEYLQGYIPVNIRSLALMI